MPGPTKAELQETVNQAAEAVDEMLDPALTREQLVEKVKELDEMLNGSDDDEDDDSFDEEDDADDDDDDDEDDSEEA